MKQLNRVKKFNNIEYIALDWAPNGCNSIAICVNSEVVDTLDDLCFGIDINRFAIEEVAIDDAGDPVYGAVVPLQVVLNHIAVSPVTGLEAQHKRLVDAINKAVDQF